MTRNLSEWVDAKAEPSLYLSRVMRKPALCICENKGTNQLCGNSAADQSLCFRYIDGKIPLHPRSISIFCSCTARFVSDLVRNRIDRFSCVMPYLVHMQSYYRSFFIMLTHLCN